MNEQQQPQGFLGWLKESVTVKLMFIGILVLLLLIPSVMIEGLITERAARHDDMEKDVSDKWSANQLIQGPVLVIPYKKQVKDQDGDNKTITKEVIENLYILPQELHIKANVVSETLHRGLYETVVYTTHTRISGNFKAELDKISITPAQCLFAKAKLTFSIADLKGLKTNPIIKMGGQSLQAEPVFNDKGLFANGLQSAINLTGIADNIIPFDFDLDLKGSQAISFLHTGKTTDVEVSGNWQTPSFSGRYLPDYRKVDEKGFSAKWRMLYYNRPFEQQWTGDGATLNKMGTNANAVFGVNLKYPVDQYQKTMRTSKYGILIILLTFISLFLTEMISKQRIHVFNYILIGAAMVIYYTLLLSFTEQVGYNLAYLIASVATITLVSVFIASLWKNRMAAILCSMILTIFYVFVFVIIQLEDLALLIGSVALFIIISALMYVSRKINWDKH